MRTLVLHMSLTVVMAVCLPSQLLAHGKGHKDISKYGGRVLAIRNHHMEFLALKNGEIRVFISDFLGEAVDISLANGEVILYPRGPDAQRLLLLEDETLPGCLRTRANPLEVGETIVAAVTIQVGEEKKLELEFWDIVKSRMKTKTFSFLKK